MIESILEKELLNLVQNRSEVLFIILAIGALILIVKTLSENLKLIGYLIPPRHKKIERRIKHLEYSRSLNDPNLSLLIEDMIKDDLFNYNSGIHFRGIAREKFTEMYLKLRNQFKLYDLRLIRHHIDVKDNKIVAKNRLVILISDIVFYIYFGVLFLVLLAVFLITYQNKSFSSLVPIVLFILLLVVSGFIMNRILVAWLTRKFRSAISLLEQEESAANGQLTQ